MLVQRVRDAIYDEHPYPCIGLFRFMEFGLCRHPMYNTYVLPTLTGSRDAKPEEEPLFLDVGTCISQDLRFLLHHAKPQVPAQRLWGCDLSPAYIDAGYQLFKDEDRLPRDHLLAPVDILSRAEAEEDRLSILDGKISIVQVNSVFHLFDIDAQVQSAKRIIRTLDLRPSNRISTTASNGTAGSTDKKSKSGLLSKLNKTRSGSTSNGSSDKKRAMILGSQIGAEPPGPYRSHGTATEVRSGNENNIMINSQGIPNDSKLSLASNAPLLSHTSTPAPRYITTSSSRLPPPRNKSTPSSQAAPPTQPAPAATSVADGPYRHSDKTWVQFWHDTVRNAIADSDEVFIQRDGTEIRGSQIKFEAHCKMVMPTTDVTAEWRGPGYRWLVWWVWVWIDGE